MKIFNAKGLIAGRLATQVARALLEGEEVAVIEVQDALLTGSLRAQVDRMHRRRGQKMKTDPEKSPKFPRVPHLMFKRMVRGMLPKRNSRGRDALHRLRAYTGTPAGVDASAAVALPPAILAAGGKRTTLGELCRAFGAKGLD